MAEEAETEGRWPGRVLFLFEGSNYGGEIDEAIVAGFKANGCRVDVLSKGKDWAPNYDLVISYGPYTAQEGHLLTVARQIAQIPPERRPFFAWWLTENPPPGHIPPFLLRLLAFLRLALDHVVFLEGSNPVGKVRANLLRGHRLRIIGQILLVNERGMLDLLINTSIPRARFFQQFGIDSLIVPLPYHESYGCDLSLERDIDVVFLGSLNDPRRLSIVPDLLDELRRRGLTVVAETRIYGEDRTLLLNRAAVLINIFRSPQDFVGQRLVLGAANKALVVSEPMVDPSPFTVGKHFVAGELTQLPDLVTNYVRDVEARRLIVDEAYRFIRVDLNATRLVARIIEQARRQKGLPID